VNLRADADSCVDATIAALGKRLVLGTPLGTGKPNHLLNAFYRRAVADPQLSLTIITALTLQTPKWSTELERRLLEPIAKRLNPNYPELAYARDRMAGRVPDNVRIIEFYSTPGQLLDVAAAQLDHANINYSRVLEAALARGLNVYAQLVSPGPGGLSLSCNPDITLDLLPKLRAAGRPIMLLAQLCSTLPYMPGPSVVAPETFDLILDEAGHELEPFAISNRPVTTAGHFIGLHASTLIRDGGTIQLGIGQLGDALAHALILRHEQHAAYRELLADAPEFDLGGRGQFVDGLYAASEMLSDGLLALHQRGILRRRVDGAVADAGFFLGTRDMYRTLCELDLDARAELRMQAISYVNSLFEQPELKVVQRRHARFINIGMKVTLAGAVASDTLADGRYVSGVGGQHDFATMAQQLPDARFVLLLPAVRATSRALESNIVLDHAHHTLPDHLRDLVVTQYGVADLRGRTSSEVAEALICIADSRVQAKLVRAAKRAGKLRSDWTIPDRARANLPERLERAVERCGARRLLPGFPLGTDLDDRELALMDALERLRGRWSPRDAIRATSVPRAARPYLERMGLAEPRSPRERLLRWLVVYGLVRAGLINSR
jgi:acyl-CoA hydrolase